ncbi:hypothetical protein BC351_11715 [Paenibacillus ferrarius]|uniref:Uncharacterized protein n=1 Tax=Paenibacillus ferrarius TaxID=1469647 RepID=A0A1V4H809_9BACL|nr:hypothetical protein BC351_11715 [Paenibacillus ferrarius]
MKVNKKERKIIVDNYFQIGGVIVGNKKCEKCENAIIYYDRYDHEFCAYCNTWLKAACGDLTCYFCGNRPSKPLEVRTLADRENESE